MKRRPKHCSICTHELDSEERDNPRINPYDGRPVCDTCYREEFEASCCRCENLYDKTELDSRPGELIVHMNPQPGDQHPRGYYRVKHWPIFGGSILGGSMFWDALTFVAPLEPGRKYSEEDYTAGPLCQECQDKIAASVRADTHRLVTLRITRARARKLTFF